MDASTIYSSDFVADTTDSEWSETDSKVEYEPVTEPEDDGPVDDDTSAHSDSDVIATKVIEVSMGDDGELQLADSEQTDSYESDSEIDLHDYWHCVQCKAKNNNPLYRYCQKCFKVRKNFFPPRPKRKKREIRVQGSDVPRTLSQDSGVETNNSQDDPEEGGGGPSGPPTHASIPSGPETQAPCPPNTPRSVKRRAEPAERRAKCRKLSESGSESDKSNISEIKPITKTTSDPSITIDSDVKYTKKVISNSIKERMESDLCVVCISEPKSGVFVHGRIAHICCCYKCAVKVWAKAKRCPICNCKVSNVLRAVVI